MPTKLSPKTILYTLIIIFVLIIIGFFAEQIPGLTMRKAFPVMAVLGLAFLVFGIILLVKAKKESGKLKAFLMLTGWSAIAPLVFSILHNVFYAFGILASNNALKMFFEFLHGTCFIIAIPISPLVFLVGVIGSLVLLKKNDPTLATSYIKYRTKSLPNKGKLK